MTSTSLPAKYPANYMVTEADALGYVRRCWVAALILWGAYALAIQGTLPIAGLVLVVMLVLPRWIVCVHELVHIYAPEQLNPLICWLGASPVPLSGLALGYREIQTIHFAHHQAPATEDDPDAYHIRGATGWVLLNAMTTPEQDTIRWIASRELSVSLALSLLLKLVVLGAIAWLGGTTFLWFWLTVRFVHGLSDFMFFRCVHHQKGTYGTFALSLPPVFVRLGEWLLGSTVMQATMNHDLHHQSPGLAARSLNLARQQADPLLS